MWVCPQSPGAAGIDGGAGCGEALWPGWVIARAVEEFSAPGDRVTFATAPNVLPEAAPTTVSEIARRARLPLAGEAIVLAAGRPRSPRNAEQTPVDRAADLVVLVAPPGSGAVIARAGVPMPRPGGVLVVVTSTGRADGRLVDPTWPIVAAARRAGARYLAHIIAIHADPGAVVAATRAQLRAAATRHGTGGESGGAPAGDPPAPHARVHTDVLVLHRPPDPGGVPSQRVDVRSDRPAVWSGGRVGPCAAARAAR